MEARKISKRQKMENSKSENPEVKVERIATCFIQRPFLEGHKAHQGPFGFHSIVHWGSVFVLDIGKCLEMKVYYQKIENAGSMEERKKPEERLKDALVLLATGTEGGSKGMKDSARNISYVPNSHDEFYDKGYYW